jgi:hypothetical protein
MCIIGLLEMISITLVGSHVDSDEFVLISALA